MGDHDERLAFPCIERDRAAEVSAAGEVQGVGGLVEEHDRRVVDRRAGEEDLGLLAGGEAVDALVGKVVGNGISFDREAFDRVAGGSIHSFAKCRNCYARWNCGSGCPSTRRVYSDDIFDAICNYYRRMLTQSLMDALAERYSKACGRNFYSDISAKL